MKSYWKCVVCSAVFEGTLPPEICPVCKAGREAFVPHTPEIVEFKKDTNEKFLIIGSGAAAVSAAESIRKRNATTAIKIVTAETDLPYFRPVLIRALNTTLKDREFYLHPALFYKNRNIQIQTGKKAISLSCAEKKVFLDNKECLEYDKLLIATGADNFIPPIKGANLANVLAPRNKKDFDMLKNLLVSSTKRIVIIGGGLLGLETASTLSEMGHKVAVIEIRERILPRQTDIASSEILSSLIKRSGVELYLSESVAEIIGDKTVEGVRFSNGKTLEADIAIISAGIRSNIELAKFAGIKTSKGILVSAAMQTSELSIFAAGDCAETEFGIEGIWETSLDQGRVAGANMAGENKSYQNKIFGTVLNSFGIKLFSIGKIPENPDNVEKIVFSDIEKPIYKALYFENGIISSGILLGDCSLTCNLIAAVSNRWDAKECEKNALL